MGGDSIYRVLVTLALAALVIGGWSALRASARPAIDPKACALSKPVKPARSLADLPWEIRQDLLARIGPQLDLRMPAMADRGEPFNPTDAIEPTVPMRRFAHAGQADDVWFVWYEHGGRGYHAHIAVYRIDAEAKPPAVLLVHLTVFPENLCSATDVVLDGRVPPNAWPATSW